MSDYHSNGALRVPRVERGSPFRSPLSSCVAARSECIVNMSRVRRPKSNLEGAVRPAKPFGTQTSPAMGGNPSPGRSAHILGPGMDSLAPKPLVWAIWEGNTPLLSVAHPGSVFHHKSERKNCLYCSDVWGPQLANPETCS